MTGMATSMSQRSTTSLVRMAPNPYADHAGLALALVGLTACHVGEGEEHAEQW